MAKRLLLVRHARVAADHAGRFIGSTDLPLERARGYIPHNVALSLLTETGLVGLGLFAATLSLWGRDAWRLWRDASLPLWARQQGLLFLTALGAYLINGMFHDVSVVPMANMTLLFLGGVVEGTRGAGPARRPSCTMAV